MTTRRLIVGGVGICTGAALLGITSTASAGVIFYDAIGDFEAAMANAGKQSKAFWDFTPTLLGPGNAVGVGSLLDIDNHPADVWGPGDWNPDLDNVQFVANTTPGMGPLTQNPGDIAMGFSTPGFQGQDNHAVWANYFVDSFNIISGPPAGDNHTGMGLDVFTLPGFGNGLMLVTVFDKNDDVLGFVEFDIIDGQNKVFLGIQTTDADTIGRVDIWEVTGAISEGISSISVWQAPAPGALGLLCLAGLATGRRRRA